MDDKLTIFIAVTAGAVVLQMLILAAMFFTLRKLSVFTRELSEDLYSRVGPLLTESKKLTTDLHSMLETSRPKVNTILDNVSAVSTTAREQTEKLDAAVTSFIDGARLQVIRVDELLTRTVNRVEDTSSRVQHTVLSPFRHLNGVLQGLGVGLETLFQKSRVPKDGRHSDEMFI
jgi:methyl-accepting chemotaxis protein